MILTPYGVLSRVTLKKKNPAIIGGADYLLLGLLNLVVAHCTSAIIKGMIMLPTKDYLSFRSFFIWPYNASSTIFGAKNPAINNLVVQLIAGLKISRFHLDKHRRTE